MSWITKLFNKEKAKNPQQSDEPRRQDFTGVMQAVAEETILAAAYWLIGLVNQSLANKPAPQTSHEVEESPKSPTNSLEELLPKVAVLIEQLSERSQAMVALETRLGVVENSLEQEVVSGQPVEASIAAIVAVENRLTNVESLIEQFDSLMKKVEQTNQTMTTLENRVTYLEQVLGRYSIVPKFIEQHSRAIAALQQQIASLQVSQTGHSKNGAANTLVGSDR
jgi:DNA repair ATPase RecN